MGAYNKKLSDSTEEALKYYIKAYKGEVIREESDDEYGSIRFSEELIENFRGEINRSRKQVGRNGL